MRNRIASLVAVLALSLLGGCARVPVLQTARPYYSSPTHSDADRAAMMQAARRFLTNNGWTNFRQRPGRFRLSAVQPPSNGMRDSVVLEFKEGGELRVWVRTQIEGDDGRWISPTSLCDSYSFSRERDIADGIVGSIGD